MVCGELHRSQSEHASDFDESLYREHDHTGTPLYYAQSLPDTDPEGLAKTVGGIFNQYGTEGVKNELVDLGSGTSGATSIAQPGHRVATLCETIR